MFPTTKHSEVGGGATVLLLFIFKVAMLALGGRRTLQHRYGLQKRNVRQVTKEKGSTIAAMLL